VTALLCPLRAPIGRRQERRRSRVNKAVAVSIGLRGQRHSPPYGCVSCRMACRCRQSTLRSTFHPFATRKSTRSGRPGDWRPPHGPRMRQSPRRRQRWRDRLPQPSDTSQCLAVISRSSSHLRTDAPGVQPQRAGSCTRLERCLAPAGRLGHRHPPTRGPNGPLVGMRRWSTEPVRWPRSASGRRPRSS